MSDEMREPTEEELRAAFEEQMRHVRVEDVILQTVATLVNLGAQRLGLTGEAGVERDLEQVQLAIEGARALAPLCPEDQQDPIRQALSQLQMAFAREVKPGQAPAGAGATEGGAAPAGEPQAATQADAEAERAKARSKIWTPPGT
ncbi:MAG: hypothetical protein M3131_06335 [Actinomycetota bacterium]|nr:hypothetical protein [Actinomycetota bacterium]